MHKVPSGFARWLLRNEIEHTLARIASYRRHGVQSDGSPTDDWTWRRCVACRHVSPFPTNAVLINPFCHECGGVMRRITHTKYGVWHEIHAQACGMDASDRALALLVATGISIVCIAIARYMEETK